MYEKGLLDIVHIQCVHSNFICMPSIEISDVHHKHIVELTTSRGLDMKL